MIICCPSSDDKSLKLEFRNACWVGCKNASGSSNKINVSSGENSFLS